MPRTKDQTDTQSTIDTLRPWNSSDEFGEKARQFLEAAHHFIGRGDDASLWGQSQRMQIKLVHFIEGADHCEASHKTLQQMLRLIEGAPGFEYRKLAVQTIQAWGGSWKLPEWQASTETRRACLHHLVTALETFDGAFARLGSDLDSLAVKLDAYSPCPENAHQKSAERILAELLVEGADALGFAVQPRESMQAEVLRIERQLEYTSSPFSAAASHVRDSRVLRKAAPRRSSPRNAPPSEFTNASGPSRRDRAR